MYCFGVCTLNSIQCKFRKEVKYPPNIALLILHSLFALHRAVEADIIITATGLNVQSNYPMSTMDVFIDGKPYDAPSFLLYKVSYYNT